MSPPELALTDRINSGLAASAHLRLPGGPYTTIVADPPWRYLGKANERGNAEKHYDTMTTAEVAYLPVRDVVADDAHCWIWSTNAFLEDAHKIARMWGFTPITCVTWCKRGPGVGHYVRNNTEHVLLASRGRPMTPETKPLSSWYEWPRGKHSEKPSAFYELVETVSPGPYLELFARRRRLGWDGWGFEYPTESDALFDEGNAVLAAGRPTT